MILVLLLLLPGVRVEEASPSNQLAARNFNHHPFKAVQFLKKTSKKGPILFPNDGPPPDPTPLIVTSRPLIESIRRSELNPNNTIQAQSQINPVTFKPKLLARYKEYKPFVYDPLAAPTRYQFDNPYAQVVKKNQGNRDGYDDYEQRTSLPIYKALSDHANKVLRSHKKPVYEYQVSSPDYGTSFPNNDGRQVNSNEYDHGENYAFSYQVKDHKTGDDFSHSQSSSGSATNGEYRVLLPDGRMQIVSYTADENGYKADVRYDDHNENANTNGIESESNKNNPHNNPYQHSNNQNEYTNNGYKNEDLNTVLTSFAADKPYIEYLDKNIASNGQDYSDRYSDYLLTDNDNAYIQQYNPNNNTIQYNDNTFKEKAQDNDYYHYTDDSASKEYKDYSNEFDYQPHKSKYSSFIESNPNTNPKPTYEQLKQIFVKKLFENPRYKIASTTSNPNYNVGSLNSQLVSSTVNPNIYASRLNAQAVSSTVNPEFDVSRLNTPLVSSTISPNFYANRLNLPSVSSTLSPDFDSTTENVVLIGGKKPALFTNIRYNVPVNSITPSPLIYSTPLPPIGSTPSSYLISTITNLKNKISLSQKPELSNKFIDKINKYLSFK